MTEDKRVTEQDLKRARFDLEVARGKSLEATYALARAKEGHKDARAKYVAMRAEYMGLVGI